MWFGYSKWRMINISAFPAWEGTNSYDTNHVSPGRSRMKPAKGDESQVFFMCLQFYPIRSLFTIDALTIDAFIVNDILDIRMSTNKEKDIDLEISASTEETFK